MTDSVTILNATKAELPRLPFEAIKNKVLGKDYELSLVFVSEDKSRKLNAAYRRKDKPTNILSFPLNNNAGEIFICPSVAKKEASKFGRSYSNFLSFLFIHGLMHLKGFRHGSRMEDAERKVRKTFHV